MSTVKPCSDGAGNGRSRSRGACGYSEPRALTQERVDLFGDLTEDHNPGTLCGRLVPSRLLSWARPRRGPERWNFPRSVESRPGAALR